MFRMRASCARMLPLFFGALASDVLALDRFEGRLDAMLAIESPQHVVLEAGSRSIPVGASPCAGKDRCFEGTLALDPRTYLRAGATIRIVLVETADGAPTLYADLNLDGAVTLEESARFPGAPDGAGSGDVVLRFRVPTSPGGAFAQLFRLEPSESDASHRVLEATDEAALRGSVTIDGRPVVAELAYDLVADRAALRRGYQGLDGDGDGTIDKGPMSPEYAFAHDERVVFRVGSRYVSMELADRRSRRFVLREESPKRYERIELPIGATIPDLAIRDATGTLRHLSDLGSRYTLMFFWGIGCAAWNRDVPALNEAISRFGGAGLTVLGISDSADDRAIDRRVMDSAGKWIQASGRDGSALYSKRFRVWASPTMILIDRDRRVMSRGQPGERPLRRDELLETLDRLLGGSTGGEPIR